MIRRSKRVRVRVMVRVRVRATRLYEDSYGRKKKVVQSSPSRVHDEGYR
jgi:hypothetical protein